MKISASIYSDKDREIIDTISDLVAHQVDLLHVDCNDDLSVFEDIKDIRKWCDLPIDLHIITETPEKYYELLRRNPVEYVTFQFEELPKNTIIPNDIPGEKGLGIVTPTAVDVFEEYKAFDFILMMATVPGQSGGKFDPLNFSKIREFKRKFPDKNVHVDGGVNGEVSFILRNMGVRASVSGSFLFKATSVGQALMDLTKREIESSFKIRDFMVLVNDFEENIDSFMSHKDSKCIRVYIGDENPFSGKKDFSVMISSCNFSRKKGLLAIMGPKRMPYDRNIYLVESIIKLLNR